MNLRSAASLFALLWLCWQPAVSQAQEDVSELSGRDSLRKAEAYDALSETSIRVLTKLYQQYLSGADRFAAHRDEVRASSQFFLGRCYLAQSRLEESRRAFEQAEAGFTKMAARDWVKACQQSIQGLKTRPVDMIRVYQATESLTKLSGLLRQRDQATLRFLSTGDGDGSAQQAQKPDLAIAVGETIIGARKVIERLSFWDPIRPRLKTWILATRALKHKELQESEQVRALWLSGKAKAAYERVVKLSEAKSQVLKGALEWRLGKREQAMITWSQALARDEALRAAILRFRALLRARADAVLGDTEQRLRELKEQAGKGTVGLKRHLAKNKSLLWSLALLRMSASRGSNREGRDALSALVIAEKQFPAGARGELYKHEDPRFPFVLGDLYIAAHRYRDALSYIYDPEAVIAQFPEAVAVRKALQELQLIEALTTNDAQLEATRQAETEETFTFHDYGDLFEASDGASNKVSSAPPGSSWPAVMVIAAGLLLVAFAALKLRKQ
jgi:hypothetical protein